MTGLEIPESKLIEALREAEERRLLASQEESKGAMRSEDLAERAGWGVKKTRREIRKLIAEGVVEHCLTPHTTIAGHTVMVNGYRLITKDEDADLSPHS